MFGFSVAQMDDEFLHRAVLMLKHDVETKFQIIQK